MTNPSRTVQESQGVQFPSSLGTNIQQLSPLQPNLGERPLIFKKTKSLSVDILLKSGEMDVKGKQRKGKKKERITWYESERKIPGEKDKGCTHKDRGGFGT